MSMKTAIPAWNAQGNIPPINSIDQTSVERSPYNVSLTDFVLKFNTTPERLAILRGFMAYREKLHAVGLIQGVQWLDGSFLEDIENIEKRHPNDIDIVTFYSLPNGKTQLDIYKIDPSIFAHDSNSKNRIKSTYHVDAYMVDLGMQPKLLLQEATYWYSIWSHRRNQMWKGYVQVDLIPTEDSGVLQMLAQNSNQGAQS